MATVKFKTRTGKTISFSTAKRKGKKKLSSWQAFVKRKLPGEMKKGKTPARAMKAVAREWSKN